MQTPDQDPANSQTHTIIMALGAAAVVFLTVVIAIFLAARDLGTSPTVPETNTLTPTTTIRATNTPSSGISPSTANTATPTPHPTVTEAPATATYTPIPPTETATSTPLPTATTLPKSSHFRAIPLRPLLPIPGKLN